MRVALPAVVVVGCGIIPFAAVDPSGTWNTLSAVNAGGVVKLSTGTVVGMTNLSESTKLVIARDGPVVLALAMALWARWRAGGRLLTPVALIGLTTACLAGRLVAEVWFASYYLLAVSAGLLVLDFACPAAPGGVVPVDRGDRRPGRAGRRPAHHATRPPAWRSWRRSSPWSIGDCAPSPADAGAATPARRRRRPAVGARPARRREAGSRARRSTGTTPPPLVMPTTPS